MGNIYCILLYEIIHVLFLFDYALALHFGVMAELGMAFTQ